MALLVCCGLATLDVVNVVDAVPGPNQKVVARELAVTFGGPAANAAATAVALGVPTRLVTALGSSPVADLVRSGLVAAGVEVVDLLEGRPGSPAVSSVLVTASTGERAVVSVNATATGDLDVADRADELLAGATALLVDGHHLGAAIGLARRATVPVLLDGGSWKPGLESLLGEVDHAVLSADFRVPAGGDDVLAAVSAMGPAFVARTTGPGTVHVLGARATAIHPVAVPPNEVVDTLGAGDVLHGAMAAALALGTDPLAALEQGVRRATDSVRHAGALGWVAAL